MSDLIPLVEPTNLATRIERAAYWLGEAVRVDEVAQIRDEAKRIEFAARQAKNRTLAANAVELTLRSERRLGEILIEAKRAGQLSTGGRPKKSGAPDDGKVRLADAGIDRKLSMKAQQLAEKPAQLFEQVIAEAKAKIEAGRAIVVNPMKELNTAEKKVRRRIREAQLAARQKALPDRQYGVIYADPEWQFETWSENGQDRAADNHYPTSELGAIKSRPVGTLAAADCVLFLWATAPMLPQALEVMRFWGFAYKTQFIWDKVDEGTGYWSRNRHEILLVGTRGDVPAPAPGTQFPSLLAERAREHSRKPDWAYELIESYFPNLPRIELNARMRRAGWDAWGLEAPDEEESQSESNDGQSLRNGAIGTQDGVASRPDAGRSASATSERMDVTAGETAPVSPPASEAADLLQSASASGEDEAASGAGECLTPRASPAFRSTPETDAIIRRHYAADVVDFEALCAEIGASKLQARRRANQLGLGNRTRQLATLQHGAGGRFVGAGAGS